MALGRAGGENGHVRRRFPPRHFRKASALARHGIRISCGRPQRSKVTKHATSFKVANTIRAAWPAGRRMLIWVAIRVGAEPKNATARIPISTARWLSLL